MGCRAGSSYPPVLWQYIGNDIAGRRARPSSRKPTQSVAHGDGMPPPRPGAVQLNPIRARIADREIVSAVPTERLHALTTYSGRQLSLDHCAADEIFVEDIAAALSKVCRFGAQTRVFYSVAQHAVLVRDIVVEDLDRPDLALFGLHHDSHEAFAGDIPSPLKAKLNEESGGAYDRLCDRLDLAISEAFGFSIPPDDDSDDRAVVKRADRIALLLEARLLLHDEGAGVQRQLEDHGIALEDLSSSRHVGAPLQPPDAEARFLAAHAAASGASTPA